MQLRREKVWADGRGKSFLGVEGGDGLAEFLPESSHPGIAKASEWEQG